MGQHLDTKIAEEHCFDGGIAGIASPSGSMLQTPLLETNLAGKALFCLLPRAQSFFLTAAYWVHHPVDL